MLIFLTKLYNYYDGKENELCLFFFDYKIAFDSFPYRPLEQKLHGIVIGGNFHIILSSYLSNRKQNVNVNDDSSNKTK